MDTSGTQLTGLLGKLVDDGLLSHEAAERAGNASQQAGTSIEKTLLEFGMIEETALFQALADHLNMPFAPIERIDSALTGSLSLQAEYLQRVEVIAVEKTPAGIALATSDPASLDALDSIGFHLDTTILPMITTPSAVKAVLSGLIDNSNSKASTGASTTDIERLKALANDGPVIKLVNDIISKAVDQGASDIHFEAEENGVRVRFRIDGVLRSDQQVKDADRASVVSRLKIMANLNISEKRRPQDGRAELSVRGRRIDIRLSTLPTQFGESVVLRLLDREQLCLEWNALGYSKERALEIERIVGMPNGIFLVAGPTGSGKTTTLYTALSQINSDERKILSVEDPIEYSLEGINQVQVEPQIDMTFARALRAILRQDPDVIMIGEIRDQETAEIAVRAALVGRMVLSTIHTNDAVSAITRLLDLGVPPYLLAATLRGVLSQRLVRRTCVECKGAGCDNCNDIGLQGRIVVSELLSISQDLSVAISSGTPAEQLTEIAGQEGFRSLSASGERLVEEGIIPHKELIRLLGSA